MLAAFASVAQPNILLIVADDVEAETSSLHQLAGRLEGWKAGRLGPAPMPMPMPILERIAANGLVLDDVWVNPMCSPTRATILTERYGHHTGVLVAGDVLVPNTTTLWDYRRNESPAKYDMAVFGKHHLGGNVGEVTHVQELRVPNIHGFLGAQVSDYFKWTTWDSDGSSREVTTYATTAITDWAIEFIDRREATRPRSPWSCICHTTPRTRRSRCHPNVCTQKLVGCNPANARRACRSIAR